MSNLEGTDSKLRNQILETPETYEASEKKSNDSDERKTRNQVLDKFESYKSSEEYEKLDNDDSKENSKEATGKDYFIESIKNKDKCIFDRFHLSEEIFPIMYKKILEESGKWLEEQQCKKF